MAFLELRRQAELIKYEGEMERGRPSWVPYVQAHYAAWHQRRYHVYYEPGRQVLNDWWQDIINVAVRVALMRGCLR